MAFADRYQRQNGMQAQNCANDIDVNQAVTIIDGITPTGPRGLLPALTSRFIA
jgi:hypothetical protein